MAIKKTILPETAVQWAWGLMGKYSEKEDGKIDAQYTQEQMKKVKKSVRSGGDEDRYLDNLYSAVYSCLRTLVITINGRNHNFKEVGEVVEKQEEIIDNAKRLTGKLQSVAPRLAAMSVGGVAIPSLFNWAVETFWPWDPKPIVGENLFALFVVFAIGVSFVLHERFVVPRTVEKHQQLLIYGEYFRNKYYHQWVERSKRALNSLMEESIRIFEVFFGSYKKLKRPYQIVDIVMKGAEPKPMCRYVHRCMDLTMRKVERRIDFDRWSTCESGIGVERCPIYEKVYKNGTLPP